MVDDGKKTMKATMKLIHEEARTIKNWETVNMLTVKEIIATVRATQGFSTDWFTPKGPAKTVEVTHAHAHAHTHTHTHTTHTHTHTTHAHQGTDCKNCKNGHFCKPHQNREYLHDLLLNLLYMHENNLEGNDIPWVPIVHGDQTGFVYALLPPDLTAEDAAKILRVSTDELLRENPELKNAKDRIGDERAVYLSVPRDILGGPMDGDETQSDSNGEPEGSEEDSENEEEDSENEEEDSENEEEKGQTTYPISKKDALEEVRTLYRKHVLDPTCFAPNRYMLFGDFGDTVHNKIIPKHGERSRAHFTSALKTVKGEMRKSVEANLGGVMKALEVLYEQDKDLRYDMLNVDKFRKFVEHKKVFDDDKKISASAMGTQLGRVMDLMKGGLVPPFIVVHEFCDEVKLSDSKFGKIKARHEKKAAAEAAATEAGAATEGGEPEQVQPEAEAATNPVVQTRAITDGVEPLSEPEAKRGRTRRGTTNAVQSEIANNNAVKHVEKERKKAAKAAKAVRAAKTVKAAANKEAAAMEVEQDAEGGAAGKAGQDAAAGEAGQDAEGGAAGEGTQDAAAMEVEQDAEGGAAGEGTQDVMPVKKGKSRRSFAEAQAKQAVGGSNSAHCRDCGTTVQNKAHARCRNCYRARKKGKRKGRGNNSVTPPASKKVKTSTSTVQTPPTAVSAQTTSEPFPTTFTPDEKLTKALGDRAALLLKKGRLEKEISDLETQGRDAYVSAAALEAEFTPEYVAQKKAHTIAVGNKTKITEKKSSKSKAMEDRFNAARGRAAEEKTKELARLEAKWAQEKADFERKYELKTSELEQEQTKLMKTMIDEMRPKEEAAEEKVHDAQVEMKVIKDSAETNAGSLYVTTIRDKKSDITMCVSEMSELDTKIGTLQTADNKKKKDHDEKVRKFTKMMTCKVMRTVNTVTNLLDCDDEGMYDRVEFIKTLDEMGITEEQLMQYAPAMHRDLK